MAKWSGKVGFVLETDDGTGIISTTAVEKSYKGDFFRNTRRLQNGESVNDVVVVNNQISIVADPYLSINFHNIRYVTYAGVKWKVDSIDVQRPRLILNMGGEYTNG